MAKFNQIMEELSELLKEASDSEGLDMGGSVVNGKSGEVGSTSMAQKVKGDVSLKIPAKDGDVLENPDKDSAYPDRVRKVDGSSSVIDKSEVGDDDMRLEDKPEKRAALRAVRILDTIDSILDDVQVTKKASLNSHLDSLSLQKVASFEAGKSAAARYLQLMKSAEEGIENDSSYVGDLEGTAVGELIPKTDPHDSSDGEKPESDVSQPDYSKAKDAGVGVSPVDESLEVAAAVAYKKAHLMGELEKAARSQNPVALAMAKAKIVDFVRACKGNI